LPAHSYDTALVLYRTVNPEGCVPYQQNFYSVPWQRIGELLPLRISEKELIVYGPDLAEIARHELYPSGTTGEKHTLPEHSPGRDPYQRRGPVPARTGRRCKTRRGNIWTTSCGSLPSPLAPRRSIKSSWRRRRRQL
jgi:hypothetical protein